MARLSPISRVALQPLLRGGWTELRGAWDCLLLHDQPVKAGIAAAWRATPTALSFEDLVSDTLASIMGKAGAESGLTPPAAELIDMAPWLFVVARNAATSCLRRAVRHTAHETRQVDLTTDGDEAPARTDGRLDTRPDEAIDLLRQRDRVEALLGRTDVRPSHVMMLLLLLHPDRLDLDLVERVQASGDPAKGQGLARSAEETWRHLGIWIRLHGRNPDTLESRRYLVWVLRCRDQSSPEQWRLREPDACATGLDLLRQWRNRGLALAAGGAL